MRFLFVTIFVISVFTYNIFSLEKPQEDGYFGMNEQNFASTILGNFDSFIEEKIGINLDSYNRLDKTAELKETKLINIDYDESITFSKKDGSNLESWRQPIDRLLGIGYYMLISLLSIGAIYVLFKALPSLIKKIRFPKKEGRKRDKLDVVLSVLTSLLFVEIGIKFFLV